MANKQNPFPKSTQTIQIKNEILKHQQMIQVQR